MNRKALSPIIATVLLISLGIVLAILIFTSARTFLLKLNPPINCDDISFRAEIYSKNNEYFLDAVNLGTVQIYGFQIKSIDQGETKIIEETTQQVLPGETKSTKLLNINQENNKLLIVPVSYIETPDKETFLACPDRYGWKIEI